MHLHLMHHADLTPAQRARLASIEWIAGDAPASAAIAKPNDDTTAAGAFNFDQQILNFFAGEKKRTELAPTDPRYRAEPMTTRSSAMMGSTFLSGTWATIL